MSKHGLRTVGALEVIRGVIVLHVRKLDYKLYDGSRENHSIDSPITFCFTKRMVS